MRILFVGDYSNLHATLAGELRRLGHTVHVVSDRGLYLGSNADFPLVRQAGIKGSFRYLFDVASLLPQLRGYDVVQLINPIFMSLRPGKLRIIFDYLKRNNKSVFLSLAGDDHFFIKASVDGRFRFSEMAVGSDPTEFAKTHPETVEGWLAPKMRDYSQYIYDSVNGAVAILPEYDIAARPVLGDRLRYIPLHIDTHSLPFPPSQENGKIRVFVGIRRGNNRELQKGSDILAGAARQLAAEMPGLCEAVIVENRPLNEYLDLLSRSHIVLDQLYAYSPATNALQAMALGKIAATGAQPEYYDYIGEKDNGAIIPLTPFDYSWMDSLRNLIMNPDQLRSAAAEGRRIVETHHDVRSIAPLYLDFWTRNR